MTDDPKTGRRADGQTGSLLLMFLASCTATGGSSGGAASPPVSPSARPPALESPGESTHLHNIRQLTFGGNNAESYFSKSGKQLIFQRQEQVGVACDQEFIINIDGTGLHRISNGQGRTTCGYFYDNDRRVLYSSTFKHDPACPVPPDQSHGYVWPLAHMEIYTAKADGSDLRQLTDNGAYNAESTVSPDGKSIIFTSTRDGDIELYVMDIDGRNVRRLTNRVGYDGGAFFSPDGKRIVWRAAYPVTAKDTADYLSLLSMRLVRPARTELFVANADGSNPRQITSLGGANFAPFWNRDGKRIIFSSNYKNPKSGKFDLYVVKDDGTGLDQVTTHPDFDSFPMWSPDGRKLVWASNRNPKSQGETNLFVADWKD